MSEALQLDPVDRQIADLTMRVGERLRQARRVRKLARRELSELSGISQRYLAQVETGQGNISIALLCKLGLALDLPVVWFLDEKAPVEEQPPTRIALIGLRGAGKSTLGTALGERLEIPFAELNDLIEQQSGMTVADLIALYGPEGYRRLEGQALQNVIAQPGPMVLAVAGGIVEAPETYGMLLRHFRTVWLRAGPEEHMARVRAQGDHRPMAGNPAAMDELRSILIAREADYARADTMLDTSGETQAGSLKRLIEILAPTSGS